MKAKKAKASVSPLKSAGPDDKVDPRLSEMDTTFEVLLMLAASSVQQVSCVLGMSVCVRMWCLHVYVCACVCVCVSVCLCLHIV